MSNEKGRLIQLNTELDKLIKEKVNKLDKFVKKHNAGGCIFCLQLCSKYCFCENVVSKKIKKKIRKKLDNLEIIKEVSNFLSELKPI